MAEKLMTDGSMALREKQYRVITIEATEKPQNAKLRVAAYARVSSASDDQLNSFAAQNRHYSDLISSKENWSMVDIYADEGITGNSHFMFQELNNDVIADHIEAWIQENVTE